jgi:magnesium transporter
MGGLMRRELPAISADVARAYFVDLYEHTLRLFDLIDTYRDLISSSLDAYLSVVSNRMNEIMQVLAIVSTIMLPLTLITGMFGMNVGGIPLAQSPIGFVAVTLLMVVIGALLVLYFKRRRWL